MRVTQAAGVLVAALLLLQTASAVTAAAPSSSVNWTNDNANQYSTNFVQQNQIVPSTVNSLEVQWVLPFPAAPSVVPGLTSPGEGAIAPPLVVDGVVYVMMNDLEIEAVNAQNGAVIWSYTPTLNITGLPLSELLGHVHGITYHDGDVWANLPDCSVVALNAITGAVDRLITRLCADIPGNGGLYDYSGTPVTFLGDVMVWLSSVSEGTDAGRGVAVGYNLTSGSTWDWFVTPPAGGDPNWDADSCPRPTCSGNVSPVTGDWGNASLINGRTRAGAGPSWGQPAVDPEDGLVILSTSQPSPDWNATFRPGPDLYSDSIVALNASNGKMVWFYQTTPHDLFDFDCGWNIVIANVTIAGSSRAVVFKACKNGYLYALDARTGALIWKFDPPSVERLNTANAEYTSTGEYDADQPWINYPSTGQFEQCPGEYGAVEADITVAYGKVYVATQNLCSVGTVSDVTGIGATIAGVSSISPVTTNVNTTIYAVDATNGSVAWSYFMGGVPYRGWLTATGGMVFASTLEGDILAFEGTNGTIAGVVHMGAGLYEGVTVGSTASGNVMLYQLVSSSSYLSSAQGVPGVLLAYGLSSLVAQPAPSSPYSGLLPWMLAAVLGAATTILLADKVLSSRPRARAAQGVQTSKTG